MNKTDDTKQINSQTTKLMISRNLIFQMLILYFQLRKLESQFRTALKQINPQIEPDTKWEEVSETFNEFIDVLE